MPSRQMLLHASDEPAPESILLRAGLLTCHYVNGDLREIALGGQVQIRRIYVAVRDHNWATIPAALTEVELTRRAESFSVRYRAEHRQGEVHFAWQATLRGEADGTLSFCMDGEALASFRSNRVGLCVLHADTCAGRPCTVEHVDRTTDEGTFPLEISPHQPFLAMRAITHEAAPDARLRVTFEGDTFEMEDQRNWTDASFKTYSRPLTDPYPYVIAQGERLWQRVTVRAEGSAAPAILRADEPVRLELADAPCGHLPRLGLGVADDGAPLSARERDLLRLLRLAHLRLDLDLSSTVWPARLAQAAQEARDLGAELELALFADRSPETELRALAGQAQACGAPVARWLLFTRGARVTAEGVAPLARGILAPVAPQAQFLVGTDAYFTELNRGRPSLAGADGVCWSMNPQVHAFDDASLMETAQTQAAVVANARRLVQGGLLAATPITLRPRGNPSATGPARAIEPGELPPEMDPRQASLFGAAWTAASLKYLAEAGVTSATYYETVGWRGLIERRDGAPRSSAFPSTPGMVFPSYHPLSWLAEWAGAEVLPVVSSNPLRAVALALRLGKRQALILANLTPAPQPVSVRPLEGAIALWRLNETRLDATWAQDMRAEGALALLLWPYETIWAACPSWSK